MASGLTPLGLGMSRLWYKSKEKEDAWKDSHWLATRQKIYSRQSNRSQFRNHRNSSSLRKRIHAGALTVMDLPVDVNEPVSLSTSKE
jgi:hypothetical protein